MVKVTVVPNSLSTGLYGALVKKELELRQRKRGTLHRVGTRKQGEQKWVHASYPGWIRFQKCLGGVLVAQVNAKNDEDRWQLLSSFVGFLDRHFRDVIGSVTIHYE